MSEYLKDFKEKCKEISNRFKVNDDMAGCFVVNYRDNADICRDCSRKPECLLIAKQLQNGN